MKKRIISSLLALLLVITILVPSTNVQAAVKLNRTSLTMNVGDTSQLKINGTSKKVSWSSNKSSVASVNSKGKVTAKKEGTATISAKVSGKTYKCNVTVKSTFSSKDAVKNIKCELQNTGKGVVALLTNKNKSAVSIEAKLVYFDNAGSMLMSTSDDVYCLEPDATCALFFIAPYDSNYDSIDYSDYKLTMSVEKSYYTKYAASQIEVTSNTGSDNITAEVINNSDYDLDTIKLSVVYYDANNNAIGYKSTYANCESSGSVDYLTFSFPHDSDYNTIYPASYKIYVNHAYKYFD